MYNKKAPENQRLHRGAEGNRTPVQTYSSKAFYMLITVYYVGK